jgi:hypothetical protein
VEEQDSMIAVGVAEDPQADPFDLLDHAATLMLDLVATLSHQAELEDPPAELLPPRLLVADSNPLVLEDLLHRHTHWTSLHLSEILNPPKAGLVAVPDPRRNRGDTGARVSEAANGHRE